MIHRRILREPLFHFLLIGLALFLWYGRVAPGSDPKQIVVGQAQVDTIARQFEATWRRPPTPEELRGLIDAYIRDEIMYREGEALGLDRDDPVIKRRIRQKLEVLSEETSARTLPAQADLAAYLEAHPDTFRQPAVVTFEQILVAPAGSDAKVDAGLASARRALELGTAPEKLGVATLLPRSEQDAPLDLVARTFGEKFVAQLETLPVGEWAGPVTSGFGVHLVRVDARTPGGVPPLEQVRAQVLREWENDRRKRALEEDYRRMRERYDVVIEAKVPGAVKP
jgi:hypothetical protein